MIVVTDHFGCLDCTTPGSAAGLINGLIGQDVIQLQIGSTNNDLVLDVNPNLNHQLFTGIEGVTVGGAGRLIVNDGAVSLVPIPASINSFSAVAKILPPTTVGPSISSIESPESGQYYFRDVEVKGTISNFKGVVEVEVFINGDRLRSIFASNNTFSTILTMDELLNYYDPTGINIMIRATDVNSGEFDEELVNIFYTQG